MSEETIALDNSDEISKSRPELSPKPVDKRPMIIGGVVAVAIVIIFVTLGILLFRYPEATAILRDIFIIFMGLGIFVIILLLIILIVITAYLVLKINDLVQLLDREIKPLLAKLQGTVNNVSGTTTFLTDQAVQPVISTVSSVAAARAIVRSLFRRK
jgi:hypothetical protein